MSFFLDQVRHARERHAHCQTLVKERLPMLLAGEASRIRAEELLNAVLEMGECQAREKYLIDYMHLAIRAWADAGTLGHREADAYRQRIPAAELQGGVDWGI